MDFVKREDQNLIDDENYKVYLESLQKSHQIENEYQHTAISMEQLHQAMQSSLNASTIVHNFQLPLSPRQMSTLMMKTNHISRSLSFNEIPAHLPRNLTTEMDLMMHNVNELPQNLRHEDLLISQSLSRNLDISLVRNLNELEIQNGLQQSLVQSMTEQDLSRNVSDMIPQNLRHDLAHEMDLSHHSNILSQEERRTPIVIPDSHLIEPNLAQNLAPRLDQRLVQGALHENMKLEQGDHFLPMPFHIKSEQEDNYFYDNINQGLENVNGLNGQIADHDTPQVSHQDQIYIYNQVNNPALNPIHNYIQNYATNARDNPQNLVVHKQFDNTYQDDFKKDKETKAEEPKENLKPADNKFYQDYSFTEKNEATDDLSMNIKGEYVCFRCNEVFPSKRGLKQHSKCCVQEGEVTEKIGKFACSQCAYRCQSPAILKIHERTHSGEKPFSCTFCDYKSGQKNNVAKHILVHMKEKPFRCQYCDYRCAQKNNLVVHERTHTGYKPFACPYCDYRTVQKPNLVKHMYLHTDQKPFSCDICSYRCVQKTNLTKHKQRHLNEKDGEKLEVKTQVKPYRPRQKSVKCPHCTYRCVQKTSLEKHMQFKHSELAGTWEMKDENEVIQNLSVKKDDYEQTENKELEIQS